MYSGKQVLLLGLGISGRKAAEFLIKKKARVFALDKKAKNLSKTAEIATLIQKGLEVDTDVGTLPSAHYDQIVISPGISPTHPILLEAKKKQIEVIGELELGARDLQRPLIAVTGTNGKTTVCLLLAHILKCALVPAQVAGNIGTPLTQLLLSDHSGWVICEMSSFQLETLQSKIVNFGLILNITSDHLDRYKSLLDYAKAKCHLAKCLSKKKGKLFVQEKVFSDYGNLLKGIKVYTMGFNPQCDIYCDKKVIRIRQQHEDKTVVFPLPLVYRNKSSHDVENVMAVLAICKELGIANAIIEKALYDFKKPEHRLEFVGKWKGVSFYNDSKATNPDAVIKAVESMEGKGILIAGGRVKNTSFTAWESAFEGKVKHVLAIGEAKEAIATVLQKRYKVEKLSDLKSAVGRAFAIAKANEFVLFSPGCASYDMFIDYADRGARFKEICKLLCC